MLAFALSASASSAFIVGPAAAPATLSSRQRIADPLAVTSWYDSIGRMPESKPPAPDWFETWESRLAQVDLDDFWDAFDEGLFYSALEAKTEIEQTAACRTLAGKLSLPTGWPLTSGALIELRGPRDESWCAARVRGYDWLTAQHEVEYLTTKRPDSLWLSQFEWRVPDEH